jgi:hypothetical protein
MSIDANGRTHHGSGIHIGGQFATEARTEPDVTLQQFAPLVTPARPQDTAAADEIARILGDDESWNGSADYLDAVCQTITSTGRPNPGDAGEGFTSALTRWTERNRVDPGDPRYADWAALNQVALMLGCSDEWGADELEAVCSTLDATGRPSPGGTSLFGRRYRAALNRWRVEQRLDHPREERLIELSEEQEVPVMAAAYQVIADRGDTDPDALDALDVDDLDRHYRCAIAPAVAAVTAVAHEVDRAVHRPDVGDQDALDHLEKVCNDAGLPVMYEALRTGQTHGEVSTRALASLDAARIEALYARHLGPAIDELEWTISNDFAADQQGDS